MQDSPTLLAVGFGGLIHESVMNQIWDISRIPLPLTDMIGTDSHGNEYAEWTQDKLQAPIITNAQIDGADTIANDDTNEGKRVGNHSQISTKTVKVSTRAQDSNTIGFANALSYQVMMRQRELRRDVEAQMMTNQGSVKAVSGTTAGVSAGLGAWIETNRSVGATGTGGGFNTTTGIVATRVPGTARALTETLVREAAKGVYQQGGEAQVFMSTPDVCEAFSLYLFDASARIAALQSEVNQQQSAVTATGAVNVFVTDFSVLRITANRLQQPTSTDVSDVFIIDPQYLRLSYLSGYRVEPLAKQGLADTRQMCVDYTLKVLNEEAHALIGDIDETAPVTT